MAVRPRPVRALPNAPAQDTEAGARTALVTRIVIVATVVLGQLFAITVALEASLLDHDGEAWLLAGFSLVSFAVVLVVTRVEPPPRARRLHDEESAEVHGYVSRPVEERHQP
ncbi:hypothetical protein [Iamia sp.]|uniref:hypothetical protein n=1 Tax=Iamia sp. TaxID=2722710 RepID=UPI002BE781BA|nr:hypothetical protein [Iamia sp.]HXH58170.1 hypothetical protein [Iamia sp.]